MRVRSPLAEIDFVIGEINRDGDALVISGDPKSSIDVEVRMAPKDAAHLLRAVIFNPTAIAYFLSLPFMMMRKRSKDSDAGAEAPADPFNRLNKPW